MSIDDYIVPPRGWKPIEAITNRIREMAGVFSDPRLDIVNLVENVYCNEKLSDTEFQVFTRHQMGDVEGLTCPRGSFIRFREDVYEAACRNEARGRFTFAHELGHLVLHRDAPLARATSAHHTPAFKLAEPQANQFAGRLLAPTHLIGPSDSIASVSHKFEISWDAASWRMKYYRKESTE